MQRLQEKRLTQKEAAKLLGLSIWQVKRMFGNTGRQAHKVCLTNGGFENAIMSPEFIDLVMVRPVLPVYEFNLFMFVLFDL